MLSLLLAAASDHTPIYFVNLPVRDYLFEFHGFKLRWYSLAYLAGIIMAYWHVSKTLKLSGAPMAQRHADDLFFYCTMGVILGGRLGYATFYTGGSTGLPNMWTHFSPDEFPSWDLLRLWDGGMSFHGGLIGTALAMAWVSWREKLNLLRVWDYVAVAVPFGMFFGRLANFVNGELWGRVAGPDVPWGIVFPRAGELPRHPSQLYEAALEGLLLAIVLLVLFWKTNARWRPGLLTGVFGFGIGLARFIVEFFREPDAQLADFARQSGLSMGQWLTIPIMAAGLFLIVRALRRPALGSGETAPQ